MARSMLEQKREGMDQDPCQDKEKQIQMSQLKALDMYIDIMGMYLGT